MKVEAHVKSAPAKKYIPDGLALTDECSYALVDTLAFFAAKIIAPSCDKIGIYVLSGGFFVALDVCACKRNLKRGAGKRPEPQRCAPMKSQQAQLLKQIIMSVFEFRIQVKRFYNNKQVVASL